MKRKQKRIENLEIRENVLKFSSEGDPLNFVQLSGKVSRISGLRYTPSGMPLCEFTIAVSQQYFDKSSVGYFEAELLGSLAEEVTIKLRIGKKVTLCGRLWMRTYTNRQGVKIAETKVLVDSIGEENEKIRG